MIQTSLQLLICAAMMLSVTLSGCNHQQTLAPPAIRYGSSECSDCGMSINDERFAAALITTANGKQTSHVFDDIGCVLQYEQEHRDQMVLARYVKDFETRQWIAADRGSYVRGGDITSPMGYALLATSDRNAAQKQAAQHHGAVIEFRELNACIAQLATTTR